MIVFSLDLQTQSYLTSPIVVLCTCPGGNHSADHIANMAERQKSFFLKEYVLPWISHACICFFLILVMEILFGYVHAYG